MLRVAICDDSALERDILADFLNRCHKSFLQSEYLKSIVWEILKISRTFCIPLISFSLPLFCM